MLKDRLLEQYARWLARPQLESFHTLLLHLGLRGLGVLNHYNDRVSGEAFLVRWVRTHFRPTTVFDVGANEGDYARQFAGWPQTTVHCFEPHPRTFGVLAQRTAQQANVRRHALALSDQAGEAQLYDHAQETGSQHATLFAEVITDLHGSAAAASAVELTTLDAFLEKTGIERIGLLKIDTEGNELRVLHGAAAALRDRRIDVIHFEFNEMNVISRTFFRDFVQLLPGYHLYRLLPKGLLPLRYDRPLKFELFAYQNLVAVAADRDPHRPR